MAAAHQQTLGVVQLFTQGYSTSSLITNVSITYPTRISKLFESLLFPCGKVSIRKSRPLRLVILHLHQELQF